MHYGDDEDDGFEDEDHRHTPSALPRDGPRIISTDNLEFIENAIAAGITSDPEALWARIESMYEQGIATERIIDYLNDLSRSIK